MTARTPIEKKPITIYTPDTSLILELPFVANGIKAGFPSPAQDFLGEKIDLNKKLIKHPNETFYAEVDGDSMRDAGIHHGDIMVIDRSMSSPLINGKIYVVAVDNEFTVKRVKIDRKKNEAWLIAANVDYAPILVTEENEFIVWGRVISVIKTNL